MRHGERLSSASCRRFRFERLEPRLVLDASMLRITEFVASNDNSLLDYDGASSDWLEIYNSGGDTVNLGGLHLTDNTANKTKWTFPSNVLLPGGGYLIVFASNKNTVKPNGELHTNFALSAGGEYLGLIGADGVTVIDQYSPQFPSQLEDISYGRAMSVAGASTTLIPSNTTAKAWVPTSSVYDATWTAVGFNDSVFPISGQTGIGYENNPGDAVNYVNEIKTTVPSGTASVYVRMSFNLASLAGIDQLVLRMKYDDGFEAFINGVEVAEANAPETVQWNSQASATHDDSAAKVFQDFDVTSAISQLHVGANVLSIHGLNVATGSDMLILPELVAKTTTLVVPSQFGYFDVPTPGFGNGAVNYTGFVEEPTFSVQHGFYTATQTVNLATTTPGAIIVYTTNGSTPAVNASLSVTNGILYSGPIAVSSTTMLRAMAFKTGFRPSFITASTYVFLNDIIAQSPTGQVPAGWAVNGLNGQEMDYGIDPDIINLYGAQAVKDSLAAIPSISITTDLANLFDPTTGIYVNADNRGRSWERASTVELINPDGTAGFTVNAGLRIRGGYSRGDFNPKHAFRFYFRGEYGDSKLNYALFGDEGVSEFDVLDLRTAQNYSWSGGGNIQNTFTREEFARLLQGQLGEPYTRSRYYHLYLDGQYWGLYETQERVEEFYGESYFGGNEADYDVVKAGVADVGGTELSSGNELAWRQLFDYGEALAANPSGNANLYWTMQGLNPDGTRNASLPVLLDVDNLIDFMMVIFYTGGYDTGLSQFIGNNVANNWFGIYNRVTADRGFQYFIHDNEHSLGAGSTIHGTVSIDRTGPFNNGNQSVFDQFNPQYLHQDLLASPEYKQRFIDKAQEYFFNGGLLTPAANIARMNSLVVQVDPAIIAESARWGDAQVTTPLNKSTWQAESNWIINTYFPARSSIVLSQLRGDGLSTSFSAPIFSRFGGAVPANYPLTMTGGTGTIYFTTDGVTDPRAIGGAVNSSPAVRTYTGAVPISGTTTVMARLRISNGQWSGLVKATFNTFVVPGDYNGTASVDAADFAVWQTTFDSTSALAADGSGNGTVDAADFVLWRHNVGTSVPFGAVVTSASAAVTEVAADVNEAEVGSVKSKVADVDVASSPFDMSEMPTSASVRVVKPLFSAASRDAAFHRADELLLADFIVTSEAKPFGETQNATAADSAIDDLDFVGQFGEVSSAFAGLNLPLRNLL